MADDSDGQRLTRRRILRASLGSAGGLLVLAACGPTAPAAPAANPPTSAPAPAAQPTQAPQPTPAAKPAAAASTAPTPAPAASPTVAPMVAATAAPAGQAENAPPPKAGGTLAVGIGSVLEDINALSATLYRWSQLVALAMFEPPIKYTSEGQPQPLLAERWETPDPMTTILHFRHGVKFHSGKDMTGDDALYSIRAFNDPDQRKKYAVKVPSSVPDTLWASADKVDDYTVKVVTKKPYRLTDNLRFQYIIPAGAGEDPQFGQNPNGTGAFKFKSFTKGNRIDLVKNESYWKPGTPYLDTLSFRFLPEGGTLFTNLVSGEVQYLHDIPVLQLEQFKKAPNTKIFGGGLFFEWWHAGLREGPTANLAVRKALTYLFDYDQMNKVAWGGQGQPLTNAWDATPYAIKEGKYNTTYDPEQAKKLLADAGAAGAEIPIVAIEGLQQSILEGQILQQSFQLAGLKPQFRTDPPSTWLEALYTTGHVLGIYANAGTIPFPWYVIGGQYQHQNNLPVGDFKDSPVPALQKATEDAQVATDEASYRDALERMQHAAQDNVVSYGTFGAPNYQVAPQNLYGVEATKLGDVRFDAAYLG